MTVDVLAGRRVLVVEDDYFLALELAEMLEQAGAEVLGPFAEAAGAIGALGAEPEAAILDLRLGDHTSLPVARELSGRNVPYLFATGSADELPLAHGAQFVLSKPIDKGSVLRALMRALHPGFSN